MENEPSTSGDVDQSGKSKQDVVGYETHVKVLKEKRNVLAQLEQTKAELEAIKSEKQKYEDEQLHKQGEFQKLYENEKSKIAVLEKEAQSAKVRLINGAKYQAFVDSLPGKLGDREYLSFVDVDKIAVDPEKGTIDQDSVNLVRDEFMKKHSRLVDKATGAQLPANAPGATKPSSYTDEIKAAKTQKEFDDIRKKYGRN